MKRKILMTALASIMLLGGTGTAINNNAQPVQAISKHSWHWHRVKVTKSRRLYKLRHPMYKRPKYAGVLRKGRKVRVSYNDWHGFFYVKGKGIVMGRSSSWFKNI